MIFAGPHPMVPLPGQPGMLISGVPVGAVMAFVGKLGAPRPDTAKPASSCVAAKGAHVTDPLEAWGWMLCDGRGLDKNLYPELFDVLGYLYGGEGATFHIPDYRGYFLRGVDCGTSNDPDAARRIPPSPDGDRLQVGSRQADAMQTHEHIYKAPLTPVLPNPGGPAPFGGHEEKPTLTTDGPTSTLTSPGAVKVSDYETRPCNIYVHYIIRFTYYTIA